MIPMSYAIILLELIVVVNLIYIRMWSVVGRL